MAADKLALVRHLADIHKSSLENHCNIMTKLLDAIEPDRKQENKRRGSVDGSAGTASTRGRSQHIIVTGPTSASALAPLPGTELMLFRSIPTHRRLWDHCLVTNFKFEEVSFVRRFSHCGHYFWYRCDFKLENGMAQCPQCIAEENIAEREINGTPIPRATAPIPIPTPRSPPPPLSIPPLSSYSRPFTSRSSERPR